MTHYKFDCGCSVPILDAKVKDIDGLPSLQIDFEEINYNCPLVWELFADGRTKGIFQLEKNLGKSWSKKVKPISVEEIAALISIIRPACLKGLIDGKSMANRYVDRKSGEEETSYFNDAIKPILSNTYGVMVYQEQTISIAQKLAGYTAVEADSLRKAMGKKDAVLMASLRESFVNGCEKIGIILKEDASVLFDAIEKSNRYNFNLAHSIGYAKTGYWCAWTKVHFPIHFFCSWLCYANEKSKPKEEVNELITDAKEMDIKVTLPSVFAGNENFTIESGTVRVGLGNVKGIGESKVEKILKVIKDCEDGFGIGVRDFTWPQMLFYVSPTLGKQVMNNLIGAGAFSNYGMMRKEMLFEYTNFNKLTDREILFVQKGNANGPYKNLLEAIVALSKSDIPKGKRKDVVESLRKVIESPPESLNDNVEFIAKIEEDLIGASITCTKLDSCNTSGVNTTCLEFRSDDKQKNLVACIQIDRIREWTPKDTESPLAFVTGHDNTGSIEIMVPSLIYEENDFLIFVGNTVMISGYKNNKGNFTVKKVSQI